ncbi:hypothetical protein [Lentzea albida]|uniref:Uncharacterized protein n=1 Tax=Lentzea albida TaxID=65499 RepID=A0A1H9X6A3_9PSEU|nr:hypothetical protein [Lentzea albida]SES41609.1 hypothetical protein SAMN04488000_12826 [Lentzea albida]
MTTLLGVGRLVKSFHGNRAVDGVTFEVPRGEIVALFAEIDLAPAGRVVNMVKDPEAACAFARAHNLPLPITELHHRLVTAGHGDADNAALMRYYLDGEIA